MKHYKRFGFLAVASLTLALAAAVLGGCMDNISPAKMQGEIRGGRTLRSSISVVPAEDPHRTKSSFTGDEDKVLNWNLLQFEEGVLKAVYYQGEASTDPSKAGKDISNIKVVLGRSYDWYALGNVGDISSSVTEGVTTEADMQSLALERVWTAAKVGSAQAFPVSWRGRGISFTAETLSDGLEVDMTRLVGRYDVTVVKGGLSKYTVDLTEAVVVGASTVHPFRTADGTVSGAMRSKAVTASSSTDAASATDVSTKLNVGQAVRFFPLENMYGELIPSSAISSLSDRDKEMYKKAAHVSSTDYPTYLEISGVANLRDGSALNIPIKYRFYLGENATTNFDVARNTTHTVTLTLTDERVDAAIAERDAIEAGGSPEPLWKIESGTYYDSRSLAFGEHSVTIMDWTVPDASGAPRATGTEVPVLKTPAGLSFRLTWDDALTATGGLRVFRLQSDSGGNYIGSELSSGDVIATASGDDPVVGLALFVPAAAKATGSMHISTLDGRLTDDCLVMIGKRPMHIDMYTCENQNFTDTSQATAKRYTSSIDTVLFAIGDMWRLNRKYFVVFNDGSKLDITNDVKSSMNNTYSGGVREGTKYVSITDRAVDRGTYAVSYKNVTFDGRNNVWPALGPGNDNSFWYSYASFAGGYTDGVVEFDIEYAEDADVVTFHQKEMAALGTVIPSIFKGGADVGSSASVNLGEYFDVKFFLNLGNNGSFSKHPEYLALDVTDYIQNLGGTAWAAYIEYLGYSAGAHHFRANQSGAYGTATVTPAARQVHVSDIFANAAQHAAYGWPAINAFNVTVADARELDHLEVVPAFILEGIDNRYGTSGEEQGITATAYFTDGTSMDVSVSGNTVWSIADVRFGHAGTYSTETIYRDYTVDNTTYASLGIARVSREDAGSGSGFVDLGNDWDASSCRIVPFATASYTHNGVTKSASNEIGLSFSSRVAALRIIPADTTLYSSRPVAFDYVFDMSDGTTTKTPFLIDNRNKSWSLASGSTLSKDASEAWDSHFTATATGAGSNTVRLQITEPGGGTTYTATANVNVVERYPVSLHITPETVTAGSSHQYTLHAIARFNIGPDTEVSLEDGCVWKYGSAGQYSSDSGKILPNGYTPGEWWGDQNGMYANYQYSASTNAYAVYTLNGHTVKSDNSVYLQTPADDRVHSHYQIQVYDAATSTWGTSTTVAPGVVVETRVVDVSTTGSIIGEYNPARVVDVTATNSGSFSWNGTNVRDDLTVSSSAADGTKITLTYDGHSATITVSTSASYDYFNHVLWLAYASDPNSDIKGTSGDALVAARGVGYQTGDINLGYSGTITVAPGGTLDLVFVRNLMRLSDNAEVSRNSWPSSPSVSDASSAAAFYDLSQPSMDLSSFGHGFDTNEQLIRFRNVNMTGSTQTLRLNVSGGGFGHSENASVMLSFPSASYDFRYRLIIAANPATVAVNNDVLLSAKLQRVSKLSHESWPADAALDWADYDGNDVTSQVTFSKASGTANTVFDNSAKKVRSSTAGTAVITGTYSGPETLYAGGPAVTNSGEVTWTAESVEYRLRIYHSGTDRTGQNVGTLAYGQTVDVAAVIEKKVGSGAWTYDSDVSSSASWSSGNDAYATVSGGTVTGRNTTSSNGNATITASYTPEGGTALTASCEVGTYGITYTGHTLTVTPSSANVMQGGTQQFAAMYTATAMSGTTEVPSMNVSRDVTSSATWTSGAAGVATVAAGLATGVAAGTAAITARYTPDGGSELTASATLTVNELAVEDRYYVAVTPNNASIAYNGSTTLTARLYERTWNHSTGSWNAWTDVTAARGLNNGSFTWAMFDDQLDNLPGGFDKVSVSNGVVTGNNAGSTADVVVNVRATYVIDGVTVGGRSESPLENYSEITVRADDTVTITSVVISMVDMVIPKLDFPSVYDWYAGAAVAAKPSGTVTYSNGTTVNLTAADFSSYTVDMPRLTTLSYGPDASVVSDDFDDHVGQATITCYYRGNPYSTTFNVYGWQLSSLQTIHASTGAEFAFGNSAEIGVKANFTLYDNGQAYSKLISPSQASVTGGNGGITYEIVNGVVRVVVSSSTPVGTYQGTVRYSFGGVTKSGSFTITVTETGYTVTADAAN